MFWKLLKILGLGGGGGGKAKPFPAKQSWEFKKGRNLEMFSPVTKTAEYIMGELRCSSCFSDQKELVVKFHLAKVLCCEMLQWELLLKNENFLLLSYEVFLACLWFWVDAV